MSPRLSPSGSVLTLGLMASQELAVGRRRGSPTVLAAVLVFLAVESTAVARLGAPLLPTVEKVDDGYISPLSAFTALRRRLKGAMIAKDFPPVKEKHQIRCFSFVIMQGLPTGSAGNGRKAGGKAREPGARLTVMRNMPGRGDAH